MARRKETGQKTTQIDDITDPQWAAITTLLSGGDTNDAAAAAGVVRQTVSGWIHHDETFAAVLNSLRAEVQTATVDSLRRAARAAVDTLLGDLQDTDPAVRRAAAIAILRAAAAWRGDLAETGETSRELLLKQHWMAGM